MEFNGKKMTAFGMIEAEWSGEVNALAAQLQEHTDNTDNPHETSLEKIGAVDYVVARGTADDWHWEMWKSGKAVCWGSHNFGDIAVTTAWGTWYESAGMTKDFPAGLFVAAPDCLQINVVKASNGVIVSQGWGSEISATNTGTFSLASIGSRTVKGVYLSFYAVGRWKNAGSESELETVLDNIIDLQEQYIGGEAE